MAASENFRASEVRFLQQQNKQILDQLQKVEEERDSAKLIIDEWEAKQRKLANEYDNLERRLEKLEVETDQQKAEVQTKDEHVRVLSEQNRQLLEMTEQEDQKLRRETKENDILRDENARLIKISQQFDQMKEYTEQQVMYAKAEVAKKEQEVEAAQHEGEQLKQSADNYRAQAMADLAALEQALADAKKKNVEYLQTIQRGDVQLHRYQEDLTKVRDQVEKLAKKKANAQAQIDGDEAARDALHRAKSEAARKLANYEKLAEKLKRQLGTAEEGNTQIQEESRTNGEKFRQMADKVYALMDSLRLNQMEVKKLQREGEHKQKKLLDLEKKAFQCGERVHQESDLRAQAETDQRTANNMMVLLKKKNRKLEDASVLAQKAQEKAERKLGEMEQTADGLRTQNTYLASRCDGQEEDKSALKAEIRKQNEQLKETMARNAEQSKQETELEDELSTLTADKAGLSAELDYIRREDLLDETGRTKPVLIQSKDSKLVEKLHINEFLYRSQQSKNPVPMLIEKLSHLLELLHTASTQADVYLQDLSRSNGLVGALRQKNVVLYEKSQLYDAFKSKALLKYVMNSFQSDDPNLYLDGLNYSAKELSEVLRLLFTYAVQESVTKVALADNGLLDEHVPLLMQLCFSIAYLKELDVRSNHLSMDGLQKLKEQLTQIEGVTSVVGPPDTPDKIVCKSGNQVRLTVWIAGQTAATLKPNDLTAVDPDLAVNAADQFLASSAGQVNPAVTSSIQAPHSAKPLPKAGTGELPPIDLRGGTGPKGPPAPPIVGAPGSQRSFGSGR